MLVDARLLGVTWRLALIAAGVFFVVEAAMLLVEYGLTPAGHVSSAPQAPQPATDAVNKGRDRALQQKVQAIVKRNPFGPAAMGQKPKPKARPKPRPELGLELMGTVMGPGGKGVAVIIYDKKAKRQDLFRPGREVRKRMPLKEIRRFEAVLGSPKGDVLLAMGTIANPGGAGVVTAARKSGQAVTLRRKDVEADLSDLTDLAKQAKVLKIKHQGKTAYMVDNIRADSIFRRLQLRNGDVILNVNGEGIDSVQQLLDVYGNQVDGDEVALRVLRRGRERTINLSLAQ